MQPCAAAAAAQRCLEIGVADTRMPLPPPPPHLVLQLTALTRLKELSLSGTPYERDGYSTLAHLPSLRRLTLDVNDLPECLSQLSRLEALSVRLWEDSTENVEDMVTALPHLQQLTYLMVDFAAFPELTAQLSCLSNLHSLTWRHSDSCPSHYSTGSLPPGPWLSSLRRLSVAGRMLSDNLLSLAAATRLEVLGIEFWHADTMDAGLVVAESAILPGLRRVVVYTHGGIRDKPNFDAGTRVAVRHSPALHIECLDHTTKWKYDKEFGCYDYPGTSRVAFLGLDQEPELGW